MKKVIFSLKYLVNKIQTKGKNRYEKFITYQKKSNHFSLSERKLIEKLNRQGLPVSFIANLLDGHRSSIYIYRQLNNKSNIDFVWLAPKVKCLYVANKAQINYKKNKSNGKSYYILKCHRLANCSLSL